MKGHGHDAAQAKFKDGDELFQSVEVWSTDKLILMSSDGRAFTLGADRLPGGRGFGEPIRLSIDLEDSVEIHSMFKLDENRKRIVASSAGYGFIVPESELVSSRRAGKSVVTVPDGAVLKVCEVARGDLIGVIGSNRKMLVFERDELPEMARGKGVKLQSYRADDRLEDAIVFDREDGLFVIEPSGRNRGIPEWNEHVGKRSQAGKLVPKGFPRSGRFNS